MSPASVVESPILVTSGSGLLADQVAEHTLAMLLGWLRNMQAFYRAQEAREFVRRPTDDLHGKTIGIVGLGGVGRRVAEVPGGFKVRILATDWCPFDRPESVEALWPSDRLDDLLALGHQADRKRALGGAQGGVRQLLDVARR